MRATRRRAKGDQIYRPYRGNIKKVLCQQILPKFSRKIFSRDWANETQVTEDLMKFYLT